VILKVNLNMNKILLTGGSGFLGAEIKAYYNSLGVEVTTLGRHENSDIRIDFDDFDIANLNLKKYSFDTLIHCAAINETIIKKSIPNTYSMNVTSTRLLTELAINSNISNFIYISTFHVYGVGSGVIDENHSTKPLNDYGLTHLLSEKIVQNVCSLNNINYLIVRPTNVYEIPESIKEFNRWTLVPFLFVKQAVEKSEISLTSSGEQLRNFVSVQDVINSFAYLGKESIVNAYGPDTLTIKGFAYKVAKIASEVLGLDVSVSCINKTITTNKYELEIKNTFGGKELEKQRVDGFIMNMLLKMNENV